MSNAEVRAFYERHPYPPPVNDLNAYRERWRDRSRRRAEFHLFWSARAYREDFSILVAGCGTSQAAKYAMRWPSAKVMGVDFSRTSVECTEKLKRKFALDNLEVRRLALENLGELEESFDQIICTGVLHHLTDPGAGLSALRNVLNPDGRMHLMVYAPYGRQGVYMLQEFFRRVGLDTVNADIRDVVEALKTLPQRHPLANMLREAPDFRTHDALADALLNPQDRAYSVPQLFELLETNGLRFQRWIRQAPYDFRAGILSRIPRTVGGAAISRESQFAAAELFRGTIARHSVVAGRDDGLGSLEISFADEGWLDYVPIRLPDTICVKEQVPPGYSGVLVNRTHAFTDILLPVRTKEMDLFEAIDGCRTIHELDPDECDRDATRMFFEQLWRHDQVVFDVSGAAVEGNRSKTEMNAICETGNLG